MFCPKTDIKKFKRTFSGTNEQNYLCLADTDQKRFLELQIKILLQNEAAARTELLASGFKRALREKLKRLQA